MSGRMTDSRLAEIRRAVFESAIPPSATERALFAELEKTRAEREAFKEMSRVNLEAAAHENIFREKAEAERDEARALLRRVVTDDPACEDPELLAAISKHLGVPK